MGEILDRGSLLFASLATVFLGLMLHARAEGFPFAFYGPLLVLAIAYVPGILLLGVPIAHLGGLQTVFQRDYSSLLTCTAMAWCAAQVPFVAAAWLVPRSLLIGIAAADALYFAFLMFFAVRAVFGTENAAAIVIVCLSWIPLVAAAFLMGPLAGALRFLASPFFLFFILYYLRNEFSDLGQGLRNRQNFHRMMQAAAVNPHDGEAQYQLGLIYQQRRQISEAIRRFQRAVDIDNTETDAHFQLGRIAYQQGRFEAALAEHLIVLKQDDKHSLSEVHRELGATYLALGRLEEARRELEIYTERREYDPEGLYHYGQVLEKSGDPARAREMYQRAVEAARTAPHYRRRFTAKWSRLAQRAARKLG